MSILLPATRSALRASAEIVASRAPPEAMVGPTALRHECLAVLLGEVVTEFVRYGLRATLQNTSGVTEFSDSERLAVWVRLPARVRDSRYAVRGTLRETGAEGKVRTRDVELATLEWDAAQGSWVPADPKVAGSAADALLTGLLRALELAS